MDVLDSIIDIYNDTLANKEKVKILERIIEVSRATQKRVRDKSK